MKVRDVMTSQPATCAPTDHLSAAALHMWSNDCGMLPVVEAGRTVGVITDRDIAMAVAMKGRKPRAVTVGEVATGQLWACSPDDEVSKALDVMREHRVRRLPVIEDGMLAGVLALNDVALEARAKAGSTRRPTYGQLTKALQGICSHRALPAGPQSSSEVA